MITIHLNDMLSLEIVHQAEAENDYVVLKRIADIDDDEYSCVLTHMQPDEAIEVATALLNCAREARDANKRYLAGKGIK